jgi:hypothetical protein
MAERYELVEVVITGDNKAAVKAMAGTLKEGNQMKSKLSAMGSVLTGMFMGVGMAITNGIGRALRGVARGMQDAFWRAADFQTKLAEVSTLGAQDMGALEQGMMNLSTAIGQNLNTVTEGLYQSLSAGVPEGNVIEFMETASRAAIAGITNLDTATKGIAQAINAYGLEWEEAKRVSDAYFGTVKFGVTRFEELQGVMGRVLPVAKALGVEFEESFAAMAALTKAGFSTYEAATSLRAIFNQLIQQGGDLRREVAENGLGAVLGKMTDPEIEEVFSNIRALQGALVLQEAPAQKTMAAAFAEMTDAVSETDEAFAKMADRFTHAWNVLKTTIENAKTVVLTPLLEIGQQVAESISGWFTEPLERLGSQSGRDGIYDAASGLWKIYEGEFIVAIEKSATPMDALQRWATKLSKAIEGALDDSTTNGEFDLGKFLEKAFGIVRREVGRAASPLGREIRNAAGEIGKVMGLAIVEGLGSALLDGLSGLVWWDSVFQWAMPSPYGAPPPTLPQPGAGFEGPGGSWPSPYSTQGSNIYIDAKSWTPEQIAREIDNRKKAGW